ncbi:ABC transporter permease [Rhizobium rhizogenes]|uniref:ABC transporter permease n=1 Tax=Rhizobium rhizogenes TaxID=359 RepID=UPI001572561B|nr:ABC transporter permease subunit [Rhizobium rhizogenes]NTI78531.1 ABC transporter permease subunit [Rhizobium rhizogenes]
MTLAKNPALPYAVLLLLLLAFWQCLYWSIGDFALRTPLQTFEFTANYITTEYFWKHFVASVQTFGSALFFAVTIGLALGFWLGLHRLSGEVLTPILVSVASVPKITLYPIFLLVFGLGMSAKVAFGAIHGITVIAIVTIGAVSNIRPVFLKVGKTLKLSNIEIVRTILLPAALPEIFSGLRIGFSLTLIGTLLGEMFAAKEGLGFILMSSIGLHDVDVMMALTLILVAIAAAFSIALLQIDRTLRSRLG